jgi:hypothetical protein
VREATLSACQLRRSTQSTMLNSPTALSRIL